MVRTSRDCQSFARHLLKAAIIQVLWSTLETQTHAQLISGSHAAPLGLGLGVRAPPFICMALTGSHSRQSLAPEEVLTPLGTVKQSEVIAGIGHRSKASQGLGVCWDTNVSLACSVQAKLRIPQQQWVSNTSDSCETHLDSPSCCVVLSVVWLLESLHSFLPPRKSFKLLVHGS